jgi:hypothetical protein
MGVGFGGMDGRGVDLERFRVENESGLKIEKI